MTDYAVRHVSADGWPTIQKHDSLEDAQDDFSTCGMNCSIVQEVDGKWVAFRG